VSDDIYRWFHSKYGQGFTSDPEHAMKTPKGDLVACQGAYFTTMRRTILQLWDHLLDNMEKMYELQDKCAELPSLTEERGEAEEARREQELKCSVLVDAIAIIEYGWTFQHEPENARKLIQAQAIIKYNKSVEA
jgi:hypothetical protein